MRRNSAGPATVRAHAVNGSVNANARRQQMRYAQVPEDMGQDVGDRVADVFM
jgi:hypothetical protein